ncbi:type IV conjugative transfer system protein TraE [Sodalis endosymbiont of Spalangia cameroni]|uniref:type IV conjugative transfer system protein TraE n=1 Tax=Sodalis praecaptivus TaxID=1239307 RepID=UPI0031F9A280
MEHSARLSSNRIIAIGFICLGVVTVLSLSVNIIQGMNNYRLQSEQKTVVTPMLYHRPFAVSMDMADASYMQQMALSFIGLRLNVTPETVDAAHDVLLSMVKPAAQNQLKIRMATEANRIKDNNVNSAFFQTGVRTYPAAQRVDVRGELKMWIGNGEPLSEIKHYALFLEHAGGVTWLTRFEEISDEKK